jgi:hypothetical protein
MDNIDYEFMKYITAWSKRYATKEEFNLRAALFKKAEHEIQAHNAGDHSTVMGHNQFSDWTESEFNAMMGFINQGPLGQGEPFVFEPTNEAEVDWVAKGAVTDVKNQGSCGSCWAFSTTGSMEGAHFIATGELLSLSEQELVSCAGNGNKGCMGGMMDGAFTWTETSGNALESEADYPYKGWMGQISGCKKDASKGKVAVKSYVDVTTQSPDALKAAIAKGPVSVAIQANQAVFQRYKGGVIKSGCGTQLDHGVLAVGYGTDTDGTPYYKVKNSWGASWGEDGYVRLAIEDGDGVCGIQIQPSQPTTN